MRLDLLMTCLDGRRSIRSNRSGRLQYREVVTPDEDAKLRHLGQALETVSRWESDVTGSQDGAWQTAPGSELEIDDKLAHPFNVSPVPWSAITAAVSHLGALRDSLFQSTGPAEVRARIHTHGQLTLVRGALENASMAYWLLEDDQSVERIVRRMQEDWEEVRQLEVVRDEIGSPQPKTMVDREQEMIDLLVRVGGDPSRLKKRPGYGEIVKLAGASQPTGAKTAFVIWKACSSVAHGELRGLIAYLENMAVGSPLPGMQLNQVTGNIDLMSVGGLIAIGTTRQALRLYAKRSGTTIPI
jgi:hypothetical protein